MNSMGWERPVCSRSRDGRTSRQSLEQHKLDANLKNYMTTDELGDNSQVPFEEMTVPGVLDQLFSICDTHTTGGTLATATCYN